MKDIELKNKAVVWLIKQSLKYKTRPQKFTPFEVADAVGGKFNRIGLIAKEVEIELKFDVNLDDD